MKLKKFFTEYLISVGLFILALILSVFTLLFSVANTKLENENQNLKFVIGVQEVYIDILEYRLTESKNRNYSDIGFIYGKAE